MHPEEREVRSGTNPAPPPQPWPAQYPPAPTAAPMSASGYAAAPGAPPPRVGALRTAAIVVVVGLAANLVLDLVDTVLTPLSISQTVRGTVAENDPLILATVGLALLQVAAFVATAAAFITWLYIARKNLDSWVQSRGLGAGWAIGGWFIPIANLVIPPLVVNTVVRGSRMALGDNRRGAGSSVLVWVWWLTFICGGFGTNQFARHDFAETDDTAFVAGYNAAHTVPYIVAAILAIVLVRKITGQQERRQAAVEQWVH